MASADGCFYMFDVNTQEGGVCKLITQASIYTPNATLFTNNSIGNNNIVNNNTNNNVHNFSNNTINNDANLNNAHFHHQQHQQQASFETNSSNEPSNNYS